MKYSRKLSFFLMWVGTVSVHAEVVTDGTLGATQSLSGQMIIPQSLGTTAGNNLFHSFQTFNINMGESATFTGSDTLQNVISRVTGGQVSTINGLLQSTVGHANFYFINPAGVTFGGYAQVDVPAAFHVSTADSLKLNDGGVFYADKNAASTLTVAEPESFGFLTKSNESLSSISFNQTHLFFKPLQTLDIAAQNISLNDAALTAFSGEIRAVAIKGESTLSLKTDAMGNLPLPEQLPTSDNAGHIVLLGSQSLPQYEPVTLQQVKLGFSDGYLPAAYEQAAMATVKAARYVITSESGGVSSNSSMSVLGNGGGKLGLWADSVQMTNSTVGASNIGNIDALINHGITVRAQTLNFQAASIIEAALSSGKAGFIDIGAKYITMDGHGALSGVLADATSSGDSGNVTVNATELNLLNMAGIVSSTTSTGHAGDVTINTSALKIAGINNSDFYAPTGVFSTSYDSLSPDAGRAGTITINTKSLEMTNGAEIASTTLSTGNAGHINITAEQLKMNGQGSLSLAAIHAGSGYSSGNAGSININVADLELVNNSAITSSTVLSTGSAGDITINAKHIVVDGQNSGLITGIYSNANSSSSNTPGVVNVTADDLTLRNGGEISTTLTYSLGKAGNIAVNAGTVTLDNGILASAVSEGSSGQAGDIDLTATQTLNLAHQSSITIQNDGVTTNPAVFKTGYISIFAPDINLEDSKITAESTGNVDASNILIHFSHALTMDPSFITTSANSGNGGAISINGGSGLINLQNSGFLTSVKTANGNGGNINVTANTLVMNNGVIQANAVAGSGGEINLSLKALIPSQNQLIKGGSQVIWQPFVSGFNVIQAASASGINGTINISSPQFNISGSISGLDSAALVLPIIDHTACHGSFIPASSLVNAGKGGIFDDGLQFSFVPAMNVQKVPQQVQGIMTIYSANIKEKSQSCQAL